MYCVEHICTIKDHKLRLTTLNVSMRMLVFDLFDELIKISYCFLFIFIQSDLELK